MVGVASHPKFQKGVSDEEAGTARENIGDSWSGNGGKLTTFGCTGGRWRFWSASVGEAIPGQIAIAEIIGEKENDVGFSLGSRESEGGKKQRGKQGARSETARHGGLEN